MMGCVCKYGFAYERMDILMQLDEAIRLTV